MPLAVFPYGQNQAISIVESRVRIERRGLGGLCSRMEDGKTQQQSGRGRDQPDGR